MKNTIILMNFPPALDSSYSNKGSIYPSTASLLIGTLLKKNGYTVKIIDGAYYENYLDQLIAALTEDIIYVGMTVMTTQIPFALEAAKKIKETGKKIPVIWGGPHPTLFPEDTLQNSNVDIVVINEGAFSSLELADHLSNNQDLHKIKGIGYKDKNGQILFSDVRELDNLEKIPHFDFSLIELDHYLNPQSQSVYQREFPHFNGKVKVLPILTALGCPYKCQFCFNVILKRKYRFRSAESIVEEIKKCINLYDVNTFFFLDEDFFINKKRTLEFLSLVEKEQLHFNWRMWCRVDHFKENYINREMINRLEHIGCGSLVMGGESANQSVLDNLCKGITPEQILNSLKTITGSKITPRYSFMVGLENETIDEIKNTYKFCLKMVEINPEVDIAGPFVFRMYPGSPIYNRLVHTYEIQVPANLEEWIAQLKEEITFTKIPWTPLEFQKNNHLISFYSNFAFLRKTDRIRTINELLIHIIGITAKFRVFFFIFILPIEYWLFQCYQQAKARK